MWLPQLQGLYFWVALDLVWLGLGVTAYWRFSRCLTAGRTRDRFLTRLFVVVAAILIGLMATEGFLSLYERRMPRGQRFTMPPEWGMTIIPGSPNYYWHGHLHRYNSLKFRGGEWSAKRPGVLRIAVLGDSLTYGYGVDENQAYPVLIEKLLSQSFRVEVFNLGHSGAQSEDIVWAAKTFLPQLQPDLVLYGVCLNDYLPSGQGEYHRIGTVRSAPPSLSRTRVGTLLNSAMHLFLMTTGIEKDFIHDALDSSTHYAWRFQRDVGELNSYVQSHGCPPVVAMVVNQIPDDPNILRLIRQTDDLMKEAGLIVIPAEIYMEKWRGRTPLTVSRWEGHPNEEAHQAFAKSFVQGIEGNSSLYRLLERYSRSPI